MESYNYYYHQVVRRNGYTRRQSLIQAIGYTYGIDLEGADLLVIEDKLLSIFAKNQFKQPSPDSSS